MKSGSKVCPFCHSKFEFEDYHLVDSMPADNPCEGCIRLYAILDASARRKAEMKEREPQQVEQVDLSPSSILARLLGSRRRSTEEFDHAKAAAGDRD